jgi:hypothetical protein
MIMSKKEKEKLVISLEDQEKQPRDCQIAKGAYVSPRYVG